MDLINSLEEIDNNQNIFESFFIHFDLTSNKHEIPIQQSIITEQSVYTIIQELNKQLFESKLELTVLVHPIEEGWLLKKICIWILSVVAIWMVPDTVNWIIKWLSWWKERKDYMENWTVLVKDMLQSFIENKNQDLVNNWISYDKFYKAYSAKNKFYHAAIDNTDVKGIWFSKEHNFTIPRNEFAYRTVDLKSKTSKIDPIDKFHDLIVVSSINTKEDRKLAWQVKDKKVKKRFDIYMEDNDFYEIFLSNPFYLKSILVKVRYYLNRDDEWDIQIEKKEIVQVYKYNDKSILEIPNDVKIEKAPRSIDENISDDLIQKSISEESLFKWFLE